MFNRVPLAWLQLTHEKVRLLAAAAGISFAVVLMLVQLGLLDALFNGASLVQDRFKGDIVLTSDQYQYLVVSSSFNRRRLYQALAYDGVQSVRPVYMGIATWKNPEIRADKSILAVGYDPSQSTFTLPPADQDNRRLLVPDEVLFDALSRPEYGPVIPAVQGKGSIETEINGHRIKVVGLFRMGSSFGVDGTVLASEQTFLKIFPGHSASLIELGLITLKPGADAERVRQALEKGLPHDVRVLSRAAFEQKEKDYWERNTGIGYIFMLGVFIGFMVGAVIVYQILYTAVNDHLAEFATLKALGYHDSYLAGIVIRQSLFLSFFGFFPGLVIATGVYKVTQDATNLPMKMDPWRATLVLGLTIAMCSGSALLAMRKLRQADPADIF